MISEIRSSDEFKLGDIGCFVVLYFYLPMSIFYFLTAWNYFFQYYARAVSTSTAEMSSSFCGGD